MNIVLNKRKNNIKQHKEINIIRILPKLLAALLMAQLVGSYLFLFPAKEAKAIGTNYYVDNTITDVYVASATCDYTTYNPATFSTSTGSSCVYKTLADINAKSFAGDDIIFLRRGQTWAERILPASSGTSGHQITYDAFGSGAAPSITGLSGATAAIHTNSKNYLTFQHLFISNTTGSSNYSLDVSSSTGIVVNYCNISDSQTSNTGVATAGTNASVTINNSLISGNGLYGVDVEGTTPTVSINNSMVISNTSYGLKRGTGTLTYTNCLVTGNNATPAYNTNGTLTDGGGNLVEKVSKVISYKGTNTILLAFTSDDADTTSWNAYAAALLPYNFHFNMFPSPCMYGATGCFTDTASLVALSAAGHEIGAHGWSHSLLGQTTAFAITSTNTSPTVNVDVAGGNIILDCAGSPCANKVTYALGNYTYNQATGTVTGFKAAVAGKGWTITTGTGMSDAMKLTALTDSGGAQAVPYSPLLDVSAPNYAYWSHEVADTAAWISSITGITPVSEAYPGGTGTPFTAGLETWLLGQGYTSGRTTDGIFGSLSSVNVYELSNYTLATFLGTGTESVVRGNTNHVIEWCKSRACYITLLAHTTAAMSAAQLGWMADEINKAGGSMVTMSQLIAAIKADHSTSDNKTYTKTYPDISNYALSSNSPAINAGSTISGFTTDYVGNPIVGTPDIGLYEFQAPAAPTSLVQYKSDGTTAISSGGWTKETSAVLKFSMSSTNTSDFLTPYVEIRANATPFTNTMTNAGTVVAYSGSPVTGSVTVTGLVDGTIYHWQASATNSASIGS